MKRKSVSVLALICTLFLSPATLAWNATGHQVVTRIAWDNLMPATRQNVIALLQAAPSDACLLDLFPNDSRPLEERQREFFLRASTWPDIVRPGTTDTRPCTRFHRRDWHFINFFWQGLSGDATNPPRDRANIPTPEVNVVERLKFLRPFVLCDKPACGTSPEERATTLAWILHLVGDLHQPLHTSARATSRPDERKGDQGGNLFKLGPTENSLSLHSYWDGIVDRSMPRLSGENLHAYVNRVAETMMMNHPLASMSSRLQPGAVEAWAREGFETTKNHVYPRSLKRGELPKETYRANAFTISEEAIALGGYRLADLLNQMFGS